MYHKFNRPKDKTNCDDPLDSGVNVGAFLLGRMPNLVFLLPAIAMLSFIIVVAVQGCSVSPEKIREETDRINMQIDDAQAKANEKIDEQEEIAKATKEGVESIKDNIKESVDDIADNVKESIDAVGDHELE